MKREVTRLSADQLNARYPIDGAVPGWHFRLDKVRAGAYEAEAVDAMGHKAYRRGTDLEATLAARIADAQAPTEQLA
jgi:hypothetical protein